MLFGIQNVLLTSIGSEWYLLRFRLLFLQFCVNSGTQLKCSLVAINKCAVQSLDPSGGSTTLSAIQNSSSTLDTSYESYHYLLDLEAMVQENRLLPDTVLYLIMGTPHQLAQYSLAIYFRNAT